MGERAEAGASGEPRRGSSLRAQRPAEAAELYRQAVSIDPSLAQAHLYLARSYIFLGEYDRALAAVRYALEFQP